MKKLIIHFMFSNFIKKLNSKWRPNSSLQKQTSGLLTGSFTSSQVSEVCI